MHDDDLRDDAVPTPAPAELQALQALRRSEDPGRLLEERTVQALRREGLLALSPQRSLARPLAWAAAAAIACFVFGFQLGRNSGGTTATTDAAYRPAEGPAAGSPDDAREAERIRIAAAPDSTDASGARFVVWF